MQRGTDEYSNVPLNAGELGAGPGSPYYANTNDVSLTTSNNSQPKTSIIYCRMLSSVSFVEMLSRALAALLFYNGIFAIHVSSEFSAREIV